jgi:tetratricopeptide (TPR) repeat protein
LQDNISLFEANPTFIESQPNSYFSVLTNAIYVNEQLGKLTEANTLLKRLKSFSTDYKIDGNEDLQIKLFSSSSSIEISMLMRRGDFQNAALLIPEIERGMTIYHDSLSPIRKAYLAFKIAGTYLAIGESQSALKWLNTILNDASIDSSEDLLAFSHLLDLMVHMELKNTQLLPYAIKSTQRFLKSRNRLYDFEHVMLHAITKLAKSADIFETESLWSDVYQQIESFRKDEFQRVALEYFDFESWAKAKVERKNFESIVKAKFVESTRKMAS